MIELLNSQDTVVDPAEPKGLSQPVRGSIEFENVRFSYPSRSDISALDGVSLEIKPGETVAFVGPSGAGKTTVIQMILRY